VLKPIFFHLINTMFQDTKDKFQSISSFVKDTEKYVKDVKLNKDKYHNYWIKTIMANNMSSSISFSGRAFSIPGRTSISPGARWDLFNMEGAEGFGCQCCRIRLGDPKNPILKLRQWWVGWGCHPKTHPKLYLFNMKGANITPVSFGRGKYTEWENWT